MGDSAQHALLSPSSAKRWMTCTPSARLEEQFPSSTSVFAEEGTLAHAISELILRKRLNTITEVAFQSFMACNESNELYSREMEIYCEQYADYCMDLVKKDSIVYVETRVDLENYIPESFGTNDFMVYTPSLKKLSIRDLKYGKGVPVSADDNPQLKIYGLGGLEWLHFVYGQGEIETVDVGIYQPRINNNSEWEISVKDLLQWAEDEVKPAALLAFAGEGSFVVGDHCKFCKASARCEAYANHNLDLFKHELKNQEVLSDEALVDIVLRGTHLIDWYTGIKDYVTSEMIKGKPFTGLKLVEGRANRIFASESDTEKKLLGAGIEREKIYVPQSLLGISALQKNLGAKLFKELVEPDLRKPAGKPTLVSADDPRPDFDRAVAVFRDAELKESLEETE